MILKKHLDSKIIVIDDLFNFSEISGPATISAILPDSEGTPAAIALAKNSASSIFDKSERAISNPETVCGTIKEYFTASTNITI